MRTDDFDYELPSSAIAQHPTSSRDLCRLAVVDRASGRVQHTRFRSLPKFLQGGDLLVLNDSRVLPARVPCRRPSGGAVEVFLLDPLAPADALPCFLRPAGKVRFNEALVPERAPQAGAFVLRQRRDDGIFLFEWQGKAPFSPALLSRLGLPPLPPYIERERLPDLRLTAKDKAWYQTVYARHAGSVAAPTAGLHFTPGLLKRLQAMDVAIARVTLHVGAGTFQPVKTQELEAHPMHSETCQVPQAAAEAILACRAKGGRVVAVGTTALRSLESAALPDGGFREGWFDTRLFIRPGYRFKAVDALVTNFHQPRSTLLPLVSAFWTREDVLGLYMDCLKRGYRFLSYGDACLFL